MWGGRGRCHLSTLTEMTLRFTHDSGLPMNYRHTTSPYEGFAAVCKIRLMRGSVVGADIGGHKLRRFIENMYFVNMKPKVLHRDWYRYIVGLKTLNLVIGLH